MLTTVASAQVMRWATGVMVFNVQSTMLWSVCEGATWCNGEGVIVPNGFVVSPTFNDIINGTSLHWVAVE
jgi:hypothetical protein